MCKSSTAQYKYSSSIQDFLAVTFPPKQQTPRPTTLRAPLVFDFVFFCCMCGVFLSFSKLGRSPTRPPTHACPLSCTFCG